MSFSSEESVRCCICLGSEHSCSEKTKCSCVPLLFFCKTCLSCSDNSDKKACLNCIQRLMVEFSQAQQAQAQPLPQQQPQEHQENQEEEELQHEQRSHTQSFEPKLQAKSMHDLLVELDSITMARRNFAENVLYKSYLQTMQLITMKAILFTIYCPESFICMVSTLPNFTPSLGLVARTLIAQRWFSASCKATLLRHFKKTFKLFENVSVDKIALMQRPNLCQSSILLNKNSQDYEKNFTNLVERASRNLQETPQNINTSIDELFDSFYEKESCNFEKFYASIENELAAAAAEQVAQRETPSTNAAPLEKTTKSGPCPMCRKQCTVIRYTQSTAEKEQLAILTKSMQEKKENQLEKSWDILDAQRQTSLLFDSNQNDKECACCKNFNRNLVEKSNNSKNLSDYIRCSVILIAILIFSFLFVERPFLLMFFGFAIGLFAIFLNYYQVMRQIQRDSFFDGQVFFHCGARVIRLVDNVLQNFSSPGRFSQYISNEFFLTDVKKNIDISVQASGHLLLDPMSMIVELQHQSWLGVLVDRTVQFIYCNDLQDKTNYSLVADGIVSLLQIQMYIYLVLLTNYRAVNCEQLFKYFGAIIAKFSLIGDQCRFHLRQKKTFAERIIYLKREICHDKDDDENDDSSNDIWNFSNDEDRRRFLASQSNKENVLFERIPKDNINICQEAEFLDAVKIRKQKNRQISFFKQFLNYISLWRETFCNITPTLLKTTNFFQYYPSQLLPDTNYIQASYLIFGSSARNLYDCLLYNTLFVKLLFSCCLATWSQTLLVHILATSLVIFLRIEILLLILRLSLPLLLPEILYCSDLSNSRAVSELSNYFTNFCYVNMINNSSKKRTSTAVKIDAIRVGNSI